MRSRNLLLSLLSHRTLAVLRWDIHFMRVRLANRTLRRSDGRRLARAKSHPRYLNLGSGPRGLDDPRWVNVDGYPDANVHYLMDFNRPFPFSPNSFDGIFCEHVVEHFDMEQGLTLFRRCFQALRPGGGIRIIVPDGEKIMRTYFDDPTGLMGRRPGETPCAMEAVNSYFRQRYEHQCLYDWLLMEHQLRRAGFDPVRRASYKTGELPADLLLDDQKYEWESLYVEATKPAKGQAAP